MLFSLEWLRQYVDLPDDVDDVARRLTAAGFNVEHQEESEHGVVLDIEMTTNRSDAMNHFGLARELAVIYGTELHHPEIDLEGADERLEGCAVSVDDLEECPRYVARIVRDVSVGASPEWLVARLEAIGQRPINNIVDVTNYVLWELGQPLHAFDLATLGGAEIRVRRAEPDEPLTTLDGEPRELDPEMLVIADAERAIALAGVMGGLDTEVGYSTTDVLIESAHFERQRVRRGAAKLGLSTDASYRFERGTDPEICLAAASRAAELMAEVAGGTVAAGAADVRDPDRPWRPWGRLERRPLGRFAGIDVPAERIERILGGLGYELERQAGESARSEDGDERWRVRVPSWRYYDCEAWRPQPEEADAGDADASQVDAESAPRPPRVWEADLYEEVLRHVGFDEIPADLPAIGPPDEGSSAPHQLREGIRDHLSACGLVEAIDFAFLDAGANASLPSLLAGDGGAEEAAVELLNPLSEKYAVMRCSLLPGLVGSALYNQRRGAESVCLFEIGHVFATELPEIETVGLVCGGESAIPWDRARQWDFFALKGVVEDLARRFGLSISFRPARLTGLLPGSSAEILAGDSGTSDSGDERVVGHLGRLESDEATFPLFVAELATDVLGRRTEPVPVEAPSKYPGIEADATITHAREVAWEEIASAIGGAGVEDLRSFGLKDRYSGSGVPEGAVNTTIYFRYNAEDRSLTQEEVNQRHLALVEDLETRFGWSSGGEE